MRKKSLAVILSAALMLVGASAAFGLDWTGIQDKLVIKSINALHIIDSPKHALRVLVTIDNSTDSTLRIKNGEFKLSLHPSSDFVSKEALKAMDPNGIPPTEELYLGKARVAQGKKEGSFFAAEVSALEIPAMSQKLTILDVDLPQDDKSRLELLTKLVNFVGLPTSFRSINMMGRASIGTGGDRGWVYQDSLLMELYYKPQLQRELLFE